MYIKTFWLFLIPLFINTNRCLACVKSQPTDFVKLAEEIYKITGGEEEEWYERLWHFYQNPLPLNHATHEQLSELGFLSESQLQALVDYRAKNGPLVAIYELQGLPDWNVATVKLLEPFVKIDETDSEKFVNDALSTKQKLTLGFERAFLVQPERNDNTLGNANKLFLSYNQSKPGVYSIGLLGKKDPKEPITSLAHYYVPYWAGHMMIEHQGILQKAILGHYQIGFGQGLIISSGFNINKTAEAVYVLRANQQGVKPTTSYSRKGGFQGVATTFTKANLNLSCYFSQRKLDAKLYGLENKKYVTSIAKRGCVYTSKRELDKRSKLQEKVAGVALTYSPQANFKLGIQAVDYRYSHPVNPHKNYYNTNCFRSQHGANFGIFGNFLWRNVHFFGEAATTKEKSTALLAGAMLSLGKWVDAGLLVRHYPPDFYAMYGKAFGKRSHNSNEQGLYLGLRIYPSHHLCITGYMDIFKHAAPQYRAHTPTQGVHWLGSVSYQPVRNTLFQFKIKHTRQPYNRPKVSKLAHPLLDIHQATTLHMKVNYPLSRLQARTQAAVSRYLIQHKEPKHGFGVMQSLVYKKEQLTLKGHMALFYALAYETRLYFYMPNLMPGFKYPMLYGKGMKAGLSIKCPLSRRLSIAVQFSLGLFIRKDKLHRQPCCSFQLIWK